MEFGLIQSLFGFAGENFLGQGAYSLLKPALGKFALAPTSLARATYRGVSQLFNEESNAQQVKDEALIGFFDGLGQSLDWVLAGASPLGCALGGGVGSLFSEGARAYTKNHRLSEAMGVGAEALLWGLGLGLAGVVLHWKTGKPLVNELVDPPSVLNREVQRALPGLRDRLARHKGEFLARGGSEDLFEKLLGRVGFVGKGRFDRALREMARGIDDLVGSEPFSLGYYDEGGNRSGWWVARRLGGLLKNKPALTFSSDQLQEGLAVLDPRKQIFIVDDAAYTEAGQLYSFMRSLTERSGIDPSNIRVGTVGLSAPVLEGLDDLGVTSALSTYQIHLARDGLSADEKVELINIYGLAEEMERIFGPDYADLLGSMTVFGHRVPDTLFSPFDLRSSTSNFGRSFGFLDPRDHTYPRYVEEHVRRSRI